MQDFQYCRPQTVAEAVAVLAEHKEGAQILAGGTDLVIRLRNGEIHPTGGMRAPASRAPDSAPPLLVYDASAVAVGPGGTRRIPLNDFFVRSGQTTLKPGELVTGLEVPFPKRRLGASSPRLTRRRGTDLASIP